MKENRVQEKTSKSVITWDDAICEAQRKLVQIRKRARRLKDAIESFKRLREQGVSFPGEGAEKSEAQD